MRFMVISCAVLVAMSTFYGGNGVAEQSDEKINPLGSVIFYAISDPQYDFGDSYAEQRSHETIVETAGSAMYYKPAFSKILVIAGDLTHDGGGIENYKASYEEAHVTGTTILDGLGNHDTDKIETTSFNIGSKALDRGDLFKYGWKLFDKRAAAMCANFSPSAITTFWGLKNPFSFDDQGNQFRTTRKAKENYYCQHKRANYYTVALSKPRTTVVSAYLIQLHNAMTESVAYLESIKKKIESRGHSHIPIIIVGHQRGHRDDKKFRGIVKSMNIAAVIRGHYFCDPVPPNGGHCDANNIFQRPTDRNGSIWNKWNKPIPVYNYSASLHNIYWAVKIDPSQGKETVTLFRCNRGKDKRNEYKKNEDISCINSLPIYRDSYKYK